MEMSKSNPNIGNNITLLNCRCIDSNNIDLVTIINRKNHILHAFRELGFTADFVKLNDDLSFNISVDANISAGILQKFIDHFYKFVSLEVTFAK